MGVDHHMQTRCAQFTHVYNLKSGHTCTHKTHTCLESAHACDTLDKCVALNLWVTCTVVASINQQGCQEDTNEGICSVLRDNIWSFKTN